MNSPPRSCSRGVILDSGESFLHFFKFTPYSLHGQSLAKWTVNTLTSYTYKTWLILEKCPSKRNFRSNLRWGEIHRGVIYEHKYIYDFPTKLQFLSRHVCWDLESWGKESGNGSLVTMSHTPPPPLPSCFSRVSVSQLTRHCPHVNNLCTRLLTRGVWFFYENFDTKQDNPSKLRNEERLLFHY